MKKTNPSRKQAGLCFVFILSHPDFNRRLWSYTRSADLDESSARGLIQWLNLPPVGNFAPP